VLREQISIDGMPLHVIDTAGLRESDDLVEREGYSPRLGGDRNAADRILMVVDDRIGLTAEEPLCENSCRRRRQ
jgi:tRNA modification GTPase